MSTCAVFFVLFKAPPSPERIAEIEAILSNRTNGAALKMLDDFIRIGMR